MTKNLLNSTDEIIRIIDNENHCAETKSTSEIAIGYVISGMKIVYRGDSIATIEAGELYIQTPNHYLAEFRIEEGGLFEAIEFRLTPSRLTQIIESLSINFGIRLQRPSCYRNNEEALSHSKAEPALCHFFKDIRQHLLTTKVLSGSVGRNIKQSELVYLILSGDNEAMKQTLASLPSRGTIHFKSVIYENLYTKCNVATLAYNTNRSVTTFKRDFRKFFGDAPHRWITTQRLERAQYLLTITDCSVAEIGANCGFENPAHFIKLFRERYGSTPKQYRHDNKASL